ncbi:pyridoxal phosphate-dependent aminotransferase [Sphingomonas sp. H39-1-10]|uniref:pyridoxal phosphate-dependent aminotransferase n=1 Tax=Sphingomonas TaxID=13687 RepID=UPI00087F6321|nr:MULTISPECIES: pyridoxal phosphate-dependent aminotransferase [Sphingomonas]MDF0488657.1 pyridoxal phosphate-dependent aminotransferase [Sphingomonas pollutisoli]SDA12594.1 histidinol-phosphate aminotransferase [Sphingomonas sp. NFR15]
MTTDLLDREAREDLHDRGYSRRQIGRIAMLLGAGATASQFITSGAQAQQSAKALVGAVRIGSNECWTGPFPEGVQAAAAIASVGNRYEPDNEHAKLAAAVAQVEGVTPECILAWPGSSDPLNRAVITFCSPQKGLVTANPTYEQSWRTAAWLSVKPTRVPLTADYRHDVKAMLAADPNAGLYYICSPNNPTGTLTPIADIEWLLANKPKDSVVLVDEAYIHFAGAQSAAKLACTRNDVIVMRTFSKLFGMAGMRLGLTIAHPDLYKKMMRYDGGQVTNMLPMTAVACGTAVLPLAEKITARRNEMIAVREETFAHLKKRGLKYIPSQANMFMVDWGAGKDPKAMQAAFVAQGVQIGRSWDAYPTMSRVTVGSAEDMAKFRSALDKIIKA